MCPLVTSEWARGKVGYMFGMYKKLKNEFTGVLTGKGASWGGSLVRPEATGYGAVYFASRCSPPRGKRWKGLAA